MFVDRGMVQYWLVESQYLYRSHLHNVLTPVAADGSYPDQEAPNERVALETSKDGESELLRLSAGGVWHAWMSNYARTFRILLPSEVTIRDEGSLLKRGQVAFHLQTRLGFQVRGSSFICNEQGLDCEVQCPWAKALSIKEELTDFAGRKVFHLTAESGAVSYFCT